VRVTGLRLGLGPGLWLFFFISAAALCYASGGRHWAGEDTMRALETGYLSKEQDVPCHAMHLPRLFTSPRLWMTNMWVKQSRPSPPLFSFSRPSNINAQPCIHSPAAGNVKSMGLNANVNGGFNKGTTMLWNQHIISSIGTARSEVCWCLKWWEAYAVTDAHCLSA
jgi:hypothetical protein